MDFLNLLLGNVIAPTPTDMMNFYRQQAGLNPILSYRLQNNVPVATVRMIPGDLVGISFVVAIKGNIVREARNLLDSGSGKKFYQRIRGIRPMWFEYKLSFVPNDLYHALPTHGDNNIGNITTLVINIDGVNRLIFVAVRPINVGDPLVLRLFP